MVTHPTKQHAYVPIFSIMHTHTTTNNHFSMPEVDLGLAEGGANLTIVSLKHGVWGAHREATYRVFNFVK